MHRATTWHTAIVFAGLMVVSALLGIGALLAAARLTGKPAVFLSTGILVFGACAVAAALAVHAKWGFGIAPSLLWIAGMPLGMLVLLQLALQPYGAGSGQSLSGVQFWQLPTGSHIAYLHSGGHAAAAPIVFLHGGPGVADLHGDFKHFKGLAGSTGHDLYVYDQVGAGLSSRLADPAGYGIVRDVQDLEYIRQAIGADKMVLIGHSYGGAVAALYAAEHPGHIAKLVLSSPGPLPRGTDAASGAAIQRRLPATTKAKLYANLLEPRALLTYALLQYNPLAAHSLGGDAAMDRRFQEVYRHTEPAMYCPGADMPAVPAGLGFYANAYPQSARGQAQTVEPLPPFSEVTSPVLILKASCDYLSWDVGQQYLHAFSGSRATLAYIPHAGHNAYQEQTQAYMDAVAAFLTDSPVPGTYTSSARPADYIEH